MDKVDGLYESIYGNAVEVTILDDGSCECFDIDSQSFIPEEFVEFNKKIENE